MPRLPSPSGWAQLCAGDSDERSSQCLSMAHAACAQRVSPEVLPAVQRGEQKDVMAEALCFSSSHADPENAFSGDRVLWVHTKSEQPYRTSEAIKVAQEMQGKDQVQKTSSAYPSSGWLQRHARDELLVPYTSRLRCILELFVYTSMRDVGEQQVPGIAEEVEEHAQLSLRQAGCSCSRRQKGGRSSRPL